MKIQLFKKTQRGLYKLYPGRSAKYGMKSPVGPFLHNPGSPRHKEKIVKTRKRTREQKKAEGNQEQEIK